MVMEKNLKYFSMFTGIGGFELGIQKAYYFNKARELAEQSTSSRKVACVVVLDDVILSTGTNTHTEPCKREGYPTGVGYELCDGCNYGNHAEANALRGIDARGADLYLYGHYYLCEPCTQLVEEAGIKTVFIKNANVSVPTRDKQGRLDVEASRTDPIKKQMGIQQLSSVGYSEIDKYAIQTYERHFTRHLTSEDLEDNLVCVKTILANNNSAIMNVCYVNTVKSGLTSIKTTNQSVKTALELTKSNGVKTIMNRVEQSPESIMLCDEKDCSICMGEYAVVVENQKTSSSLLNIKTTMDTLNEKNTEQAICINSPSKSIDLINMKSCATTVITLKGDGVYVHTKRTKQPTNFGNATTIDSAELPDFNVLVGGFPCQSFSVAGKRGGFNDTRGTLFFDVARILKDKKPEHLVLENVKGLLSHDGGRTFETIIGVLTDLGYSVEWQVLNSKDFGVPQNRERVYIVGHLGGFCGRKVFPLRSDYESSDELQGQQAYSTTITTRYTATGNGTYVAERELNAQKGKVKQIGQIYDNPHNSQAGRIYDKEGISPTLDVAAGGNRQPKVVVAAIRGRQDESGEYVQQLEERDDNATNTLTSVHKDNMVAMRWVRTEKGKEIRREAQKNGGKDYTPFNGEARTLAPSDSGIIGTITSQAISKDSLLGDGMRIRRLTPKECERLQGFPDDWTIGVSDSQRYKQCGNAVTTNVVQAVFEKLLQVC